jgi:hypothetical protein
MFLGGSERDGEISGITGTLGLGLLAIKGAVHTEEVKAI